MIPKGFIAKPFQYHEEIELTIVTLTNEGRGIGRINDWAVMVPFVIPGEVVKARIFKNHKNYSEADLIEIIKASTERMEPRCPLFGQCGGCQYQHITYAEQLKWKRQQVVDCLERIGKLSANVNEVIASKETWGYRTKLTPHFERHGDKCPIGFLREGSRRIIVDVPQCMIADKSINDALPQIREQIQVSSARNGTLLLRVSDRGIISDFNAICETTVCGLKFKFPAGSFFQNNPYTLESIFTYLEEKLQQNTTIRYLVDTYCGVGVFGIALSKFIQRFVGIEIDEKSIQLANQNMQINHIEHGEFVAGDATSIFSGVAFNPDETCVIMDPPRKGTTEDYLNQLIAFFPKMVVYISCAPDTQARDLKLLLSRAPAYSIADVQPFDMFPQTKHVENVVLLTRT